MRLSAAVLLFLCACDPALNMSSGPLKKRTIETCPEAVAHLKECCPRYESYLSCNVLESWEGAGSGDFSPGESRCLNRTSCAQIEKAVTNDKSLCGVTFRGTHCR